MLPHRWLPEGTSLYDRLGKGLSLLRLRDDADAGPFLEAAAASGVPLTMLDLRGQKLEDIYGASLLLVRPDQHVAWRGTFVNRSIARAVIDRVRGV